MTSLNLGPLPDNLLEIYYAVHNKTPASTRLVANVCGTRVYDASRGWGRLWRYFWTLVGIFIGDSKKIRALHQAMLKTQKTFQQNLPYLEQQMKSYQDCVTGQCDSGRVLNPSIVREAESAIKLFNDATLPLLKLAKKNTNPVLAQLFKEHFAKDIEAGQQPFDTKFVDACAEYQDLIDLQSLMFENPLPLNELKKLAYRNEYRIEDRDIPIIERFIKEIKDNSNITVRKLHAAFRSFCQHLLRIPPHGVKSAPHVAILENALRERGCDLFSDKVDRIHMRWRTQLRSGLPITCNGRPVVLGARVGDKKEKEDHYIYFRAKDMPDTLVCVGFNRAILGVQEERCKTSPVYPRNVRILEVDADGSCALVEELQEPIDRIAWNPDRLSARDRQVLGAAIQALSILRDPAKETPHHFSPEYMMLDNRNALAFRRITQGIKKHHFSALTDFAFKLATGNRAIFKILMDESGLAKDDRMKFHEYMVELALRGKETNARDEGTNFRARITDPFVLDRAQRIYTSVFNRRTEPGSVDDHLWKSFKELETSNQLYDPVRLIEDIKKKRVAAAAFA